MEIMSNRLYKFLNYVSFYKRFCSKLYVLIVCPKTARRQEIEENEVLEKKQQKLLTEQNISLEGKRKTAFLDLLLQVKLSDGSSLSNSDIQEEVDTFMFEGHDTTTCSLAWTIFLIGHYPKVQIILQYDMFTCNIKY